jgi:large subunit ribosomal protein L13
MSMQTRHLNTEDARTRRRWYVVDADGQVLGRLASRVASVLRGKESPAYSPHLDAGDFVVVVNAARVRVTGEKLGQKVYHRVTGYPGGVRRRTAAEILARFPERLVRNAVTGMLPKTRLGRQLARKLKVYAGPDHPHGAQQPEHLPLRIGGGTAKRPTGS